MASIDDLAAFVLNRLEETNPPEFWDMAPEVYSAVTEAMCDLMLLVGRPDLVVSRPFTIQPNTPWQTVPEGVFCITNLQGGQSEIWKISLQDLDYAQVSGADWEQDIGPSVQKWAPIGLTRFVVWPCVAQAQQVLLTGIAAPVTGSWPFAADSAVPFHDEFFQAIEKYAAHYLRIKEGTNEFSESMKLFQGYLEEAKRMTALEDRKDPYLFNAALGGQIVANPTKTR